MEKGQAALEFIMTYGWAILAVLLSIGALAYFGVLNPSIFLPSSCTLMQGLGCDEFIVDASAGVNGQVQLIIRNGIGDSVDFSTIGIDTNLDGDTADATDCADINQAAVDPAAIADGALSQILAINCPAGQIGLVGSRFRGDIIGTYTLGAGTLEHTMVGSIIVKVEGVVEEEESIVPPGPVSPSDV